MTKRSVKVMRPRVSVTLLTEMSGMAAAPLPLAGAVAAGGAGGGAGGSALRPGVWVSCVIEPPACPGAATRSMTLSRPCALSRMRP